MEESALLPMITILMSQVQGISKDIGEVTSEIKNINVAVAGILIEDKRRNGSIETVIKSVSSLRELRENDIHAQEKKTEYAAGFEARHDADMNRVSKLFNKVIDNWAFVVIFVLFTANLTGQILSSGVF